MLAKSAKPSPYLASSRLRADISLAACERAASDVDARELSPIDMRSIGQIKVKNMLEFVPTTSSTTRERCEEQL